MITDPMRDLLAAVLEALDIPSPATIGDREARDRVLNDRAMHSVIALRSVLDDKPLTNVEWTTQYLRERLADHPPNGYRHHGSEPAPACGHCRQPFDPTDKRFDGRARHADTPWCRACVDRCHESTDAFHACPMCDPARRGGEGR
ncbi:hypothetical protein ACWGI8_00880 [Streptomyces sp. NPDC054841]